jgi:membrane protein DedA with SNARE-associated domain
MATIIELIIIFLTAFGFNLIPFAGPSNLLIASTAAISLVNPDTTTLLIVGCLIALAASLAKGVHYMVTFFVSKHLSEKKRVRLDADAARIRRWAFLLLYLAAATPIPDEPVVIPLGLMKYSPAKFFLAYFLGKISITTVGAFLGNFASGYVSAWLSPEVQVAISIALTIIVTIILLKVDFGKLFCRFRGKEKKDKTNNAKPLERENNSCLQNNADTH